eukprot:TRINITY_DN1072_c0_g1_i14.p1 TRINITY_DN1072_c0_g1~~TRINITY_DN1072_c0_g1_i14.p1  ORF type:complete len:170 (+),score=10.74 TRINITY_DN1072_c0_g1_i14:69-578(+)
MCIRDRNRAKMKKFLGFVGVEGEGFNLLMDSLYTVTDGPATDSNRISKRVMSGALLETGEVIKITYEPEMQKLSFNWRDQKSEITNIEEKADDTYYPVVVFYCQNQALKIVSSDEYKGQDQVFCVHILMRCHNGVAILSICIHELLGVGIMSSALSALKYRILQNQVKC